MKTIILVFSFFLTCFVQAQEINKILGEAVTYESALDENKALVKYLQVYNLQPENLQILCRISELYSSIAGRIHNNNEQQEKYFNSAYYFASKALTVNPQSSDANFVMALFLGRTALKKSGRSKIDAVKNIKKFTDLSIRYNPSNYKSWFLLGKWYYEISGLNFFERTAVRMFYRDLPNATTNEAISAYRHSMQIMPSFIFNYLSLAKAYLRIGNKQKAKDLLVTMSKLPDRTADDPTIKVEGNVLLNNL